MAIEGRRDTIIYKVLVPIAGAILGALAATWFGAAKTDQTQLAGIAALLHDTSLNGQQKMQALEIYKEITDRPWAVVRSLVSTLGFVAIAIGFAYAVPIQNRR